MTTAELLLTAWAPGLVVPVVCFAAALVYVAQFRARLDGRVAFFGLALGIFFVALASPIGVLARGYLFSAHMLQHLLLMLAVPPLLLLGLPREPASPRTPERFSEPETVTIAGSWLAGVGAMWLWHARPLCNAAAVSPTVQAVQTISLLVMGLAFWRPVMSPRAGDLLPPFHAMLYLFAACVGCTLLGILVTLSPVEVCSAYMHPSDSLGVLPLVREGWGLDCKADQQVGGLLMWVPACLVYASAILATLGRYYAEGRAPSSSHVTSGGRR